MSAVLPGRRPVGEALRAGRRLREVVVADGTKGLGELVDAARARQVPVRTALRSELDELAGGVVHQGVVALAHDFAYATVAALARSTDLVVVLDGITDPQNLGAIARSAEAAGAGGLVLPRRRAAHVTAAAEKAAAGAFSWLAVALSANVAQALVTLAEEGFWSVGLAGAAPESMQAGTAGPGGVGRAGVGRGGLGRGAGPRSAVWSEPLLDGKVALVVGAEGVGLSRLVSERVDAVVSIPMRGHVGSLNASAAAAVALFEVVRRRSVR